jgi:hypothetical protein
MALRLRRLEDGQGLQGLPGEAAVITEVVVNALALLGAFVVGVAVGAAIIFAAWSAIEHMREDLKSMEG